MENYSPIEILLIENNPDDAALALRALTRNHLVNHVEVINDGADALDFLFHRGRYADRISIAFPRVIFLDLHLPGVNGFEILKDIRANEVTRKLPVVVVSSSREEPDISRAYELGANSYVVKPADLEMFIKVISELGMYWLILNEPPKIVL